jgi:hypothetical protein
VVPLEGSAQVEAPQGRGDKQDNPEEEPRLATFMASIMPSHPRAALVFSVLLWLLAGGVSLLFLLFGGQRIWEWGADTWYLAIIAIVGIGFIVLFTFGGLAMAAQGMSKALDQYLQVETYKKQIENARRKAENAENAIDAEIGTRLSVLRAPVATDRAIGFIDKSAAQKLLLEPLVRDQADERKRLEDLKQVMGFCKFRREQLTVYYTTNLRQTKISFRCSLFAMFAGFFIIAVGIASSFGFLELIFPEMTPTDINNVVISGGALSAVISGAFLWIYVASTKQLMYFYQNQALSYSVLTCYKIVDSVSNVDKRDDAKLELIRMYLKSLPQVPSIELPQADKQPSTSASASSTSSQSTSTPSPAAQSTAP